eukprot:gene3697-2637_t
MALAGDEFECPQEFLCPVSGGLLFDPVVAFDGFSYERRDLEYWIERQKRLKEPDRTSYEFPSPMTKAWIPVDLYENRALRDFIAVWAFREKAHHERAEKLKDLENRVLSAEDVYLHAGAMFREKTAGAPDSAVVPKPTLTLRDATDEDAPPDTCDIAGKREVFKRFCALLASLKLAGILNDSGIIFNTYQYTAAPVYIVDYIQRQDVLFGQGNDRIPLHRLLGVSSAEEVPQTSTFNQLFGRIGIYVEVHNLRFETISSTDAAVAFTCEIKRHKTYSVAALATTLASGTGANKIPETERDETSQHIAELEIENDADYGGWASVAKADAIPPLVWQSGHGDADVRQNTPNTLPNIANNAENHVSVSVVGAIAPLVGRLDDGDVAVRRNAAGALQNIAANVGNKVLLAEAGAIGPLVRLLGDFDVEVRGSAAGELINIAANIDNKMLVVEAGAIAPLMGLLGDSDVYVRRYSAGALANIASYDKNQVLVAEAGSISPLVRLLGDGDVEVRRNAAGALSNIAVNAENKVLVAEASAIVSLVGL